MPSVSLKQRAFMKKAATDPEFAESQDIPQKVAQEFRAADLKKMRTKHRIHDMYARTNATS